MSSDEDDDSTHSRFIVKMDDHAAMAGASEDKIMRTTKVITKRPTRATTDGVFNLKPMDAEEGRISDESREFVLSEIEAGRIVIDPNSTTRHNSIRAAIFDEFERRLKKHRESKSQAGNRTTEVNRQGKGELMSNERDNTFDDSNLDLDLDDLDDPSMGRKLTSRPTLGVSDPNRMKSFGKSSKGTSDAELESILRLPGFKLDVSKQSRIYCQLSPESEENPALTFASHWYYTIGGANPTDMVFIVDKRDTEASEALQSMLPHLLGDLTDTNAIYYAKVTAEVSGSDELQNITALDLTCQLNAGSLEFGIFHVIVIPLQQ